MTSAPPYQLILLSKIHTSLVSRSSESTSTESVTSSTPSAECADLGRSRFLRHGERLRRSTSWIDSPTPEIHLIPNLTSDLTSNSPVKSKHMGSKTPQLNKKMLSHWTLSTLSWPQKPPHSIKQPQQISNLVVSGFYFCLWSCDYTKCTGHLRANHFRPLLDFVLFVGDTLLPPDASIKQSQHAHTKILQVYGHQVRHIQYSKHWVGWLGT